MRFIDQFKTELAEAETSKRYRKNWIEEDYRVALDLSISAKGAARIIGCHESTVRQERAEWGREARAEPEPAGVDVGVFLKPVQDGFKRCLKCAKDLPVFEFSKDKYRADGYGDKCLPCQREYSRRRRELRRVYGAGE